MSGAGLRPLERGKVWLGSASAGQGSLTVRASTPPPRLVVPQSRRRLARGCCRYAVPRYQAMPYQWGTSKHLSGLPAHCSVQTESVVIEWAGSMSTVKEAGGASSQDELTVSHGLVTSQCTQVVVPSLLNGMLPRTGCQTSSTSCLLSRSRL